MTIAASSVVGEHRTLGYPKEARLRAEQHQEGSAVRGAPVTVGQRCLLANHVVLYEGVRIGDDCVIEDRVRIGYHSMVSERTRVATENSRWLPVRPARGGTAKSAARWP